MRRRLISSTFALALLCLGAPGRADLSAGLQRELQRDIGWLAADARQGRGLATKGIDEARRFLVDQLSATGLEPAFEGSYEQPFRVKIGVKRGEGNEVEGLRAGDWVPAGYSGSGSFEGPVVFAGYGIEAPPLGYSDFEGLDIEGKVVLMMRYEPQEKDDGSPFDGRRASRWSAQRYKVHQAERRGAAAVIFFVGPLNRGPADELPPLRNDGPESPVGIPVLHVRGAVAEAWLTQAGLDVRALQEAIDRDLRPASRPLQGLRIRGRVALEATFASTANVAALLPGRGALARQIVVLGAHYDHLGMGGQGSLRPNDVAPHNGADDNASGTAVALAVARRLRAALADVDAHRTIIVALFSAEEVGIAGSAYFTHHGPVDMDRVVAMVNLDMVGRLRNDTLYALGTETAALWTPLLDRLAATYHVTIDGGGDGYGPSDQTSFFSAGVPVVHLFTGAHEQYHTPDDDVDLINLEGTARIAALTRDLIVQLARRPEAPLLVRPAAAPPMEGDSRGYRAWLGTVPDFSAMGGARGGVLLADVRRGGPADLAGLQAGDRIVEMAGVKIDNLYDMTFVLQEHRPGDLIDITLIRQGERLHRKATLRSRSDMKSAAKAAPAAPHPAPPTPPASLPHQASPAHPAPPPGAAAAGEDQQRQVIPFERNRPGPSFTIGAGRVFPHIEAEGHLLNLRQLTFDGENAEAYFSPDGTKIIFQRTPPDGGCDQQYIMDLATGDVRRVSTGRGRTTCGYFDWPEADRIVYASTEATSPACPPPPDRRQGYVWPIYEGYDIYEAELDGSNPRRLTTTPGYDAEMTWCHRGGKMVFTSVRDGDLDLYEMDEAGHVRRLTDTPGYDGGAFYNSDCSRIVWRASRPTGQALEDYRALLSQNLVRPSQLEIFVMNADGSHPRQVTSSGAANFAPFFHPDGRRIIYASNAGTSGPREFELFLVDSETGEIEQVTFSPGFDGFPVFSPDGRFLVWGSNRADPSSHQTNIFIAEWVEEVE